MRAIIVFVEPAKLIAAVIESSRRIFAVEENTDSAERHCVVVAEQRTVP